MFSGSSNNSSFGNIRNYFNYVMVLLYIAIGLGFLFTDIGIETFPVYREVVGGILLVYAVFRLFMTVKRVRRGNNEAL